MQIIRDFVFDLQTFSHSYHKILLTVLIAIAPNYLTDGYKFFFTHGFLKLFHTYFLEGEKTHCRKQALTKMPKVCFQHSANFFRQKLDLVQYAKMLFLRLEFIKVTDLKL
jgi:hypothetical protein